MTRIADFIATHEPALRTAGVQNPRADLERIAQIAANGNEMLDERAQVQADHMARRRAAREPMERILNRFTFYGLEMELQDGVFKPGFETETTVEHGLDFLKNLGRPARILDLGTGSGCVLIALLKMLPDASGIGVDMAQETLDLARRNATTHGVSERAMFMISDWTLGVEGMFDLIISNPPRIPTRAINDLVREVRIFDPHASLDGGVDGSHFYTRTAQDAPRILSPDGICLLQVGNIVAAQAIRTIWRQGYRDAEFLRDYKGAFNCVRFGGLPRASGPVSGFAALIGGYARRLAMKITGMREEKV